jgi:hypothetical protein
MSFTITGERISDICRLDYHDSIPCKKGHCGESPPQRNNRRIVESRVFFGVRSQDNNRSVFFGVRPQAIQLGSSVVREARQDIYSLESALALVAKRGHGNTPRATVAKRGHDTTRHIGDFCLLYQVSILFCRVGSDSLLVMSANIGPTVPASDEYGAFGRMKICRENQRT